MNEFGRLDRNGVLAIQKASGKPSQLVVNKRQKPVKRLSVGRPSILVQLVKQEGYFGGHLLSDSNTRFNDEKSPSGLLLNIKRTGF